MFLEQWEIKLTILNKRQLLRINTVVTLTMNYDTGVNYYIYSEARCMYSMCIHLNAWMFRYVMSSMTHIQIVVGQKQRFLTKEFKGSKLIKTYILGLSVNGFL